MGEVAAIVMASGAGLAMALQSPTNGSLGTRIGAHRATIVNFLGGEILLVLAVALFGTGDLTQLAVVPWWQFLGGFYGIAVVLAVATATPVLGVALSLTAVMLGQVSGGMVIDAFGWFETQRQPLDALRVLGCLATLVGIVFVYISRQRLQKGLGGQADAPFRVDGAALRLLALVFCSGVLSAIQSPTNAALVRHVGSLEAPLVNFTVGLALALVVGAVTSRMHGERLLPPVQDLRGTSPWQYTGGVYGVAIVILAVRSTPVIGVGLMVTCQMLGQLGGGMVIDAFGLMRTPRVRMDGWRIAGVGAIGLGIVLVALGEM